MSNGQPLIGQRLGNYKVLSFIGQGGMAAVYLARDVALKRDVVIKVMLPHLAETEVLRLRFQREARATAKLAHHNIVPVYTTGSIPVDLPNGGLPYIALQYVAGGSLRDKLKQLAAEGRWISTLYALTIVQQMAEALLVAHRAGIIHRDLKPANILLRGDGTPVLSDLGIAAIQQENKRLTQTGGVIGTPNYMSPEQAGGHEIDGRSDLYSLGVILYELLSGNLPFDADSPIVMLHKHIYEQPTPLRRVRTDLTEQTYHVVETCLQKEPAHRYPDAAVLMTSVTAALRAESGNSQVAVGPSAKTIVEPVFLGIITTTESDDLAQPRRAVSAGIAPPAARWPYWRFGLAGLAIILLGVILFVVWQNGRPSEVVAVPLTIEPTITVVATAVPIINIDPTETVVIVATAVPPTANPTPTPIPAPVPSPTAGPGQIVFQSNRDGDFEIFIMNHDGSNQRQLTFNTDADNYPVVSPDGQRILFQSERDGNKEVYVMNLDGGDQQRLTVDPGVDRLPTWSPDSLQIVFISSRSGSNNLYVMNADGSDLRIVTNDEELTGHPSWSVNDELVFSSGTVSGNTWEIYVVDVNGRNRRQLTNNNVSDWSPEWSPDGRSILYIHSISKSDEAAIFIMDSDGRNQRLLFSSADYEWGADWTPDGQHILFTREIDGYSHVYRVDTSGDKVTFIAERAGYPSWAP